MLVMLFIRIVLYFFIMDNQSPLSDLTKYFVHRLILQLA